MMNSKTTMNQEFDSRRSETNKTPHRQSARSEEKSPEDRFASRMGVIPPSSFDFIRNLGAYLQDQDVSQGAAVEDGHAGGQCDRRGPSGEPTFREPISALSQTSPQEAFTQRPPDKEWTRHRVQDHHSDVNYVFSDQNQISNFRAYNSEPTFGQHVRPPHVDCQGAAELRSHVRSSDGLGNSYRHPHGRDTGYLDTFSGSHRLGQGMPQNLMFPHEERRQPSAGLLQRFEGAGNPHVWDKRSEPKVHLLQYGGQVEWKVYWLQFELIARRFGWSLDQTLDRLVSSLKDTALEYYADLPHEIRSNLTSLIGAFERRFGDKKLPQVYRATLQTLSMSSKESLQDYAARVDRTVRRAYPNLRGAAEACYLEEMIVEQLIDGYHDSAIAYEVKTKDPKSVEEALDLLQWHGVCRRSQGRNVGIRQLGVAAVEEYESEPELSVGRTYGEKCITEDQLHQLGRDLIRKIEEIQSKENPSDDWKRTAECNYCHEIGHIKYDCPKKRKM